MTRFRAPPRLVPLLLLLFAASPAWPQKTAIDDLCRLHGMNEESSLAQVRKAYSDAVGAGISEEELLPFVEDILIHKLDCGQMIRVLAATEKLRRENLPYFVVFSKVREGVAKEASPALVVEAAESKFRSLSASRGVLLSLKKSGFRILDFQNAAVIVSSYLEKGYSPRELVSEIRTKGIARAGFAALSGVLGTPPKRKDR